MSCDRCEDVHKAQKEGKTQNKCKCDCHNNTSTLISPTFWNNDTLCGTATITTGTSNIFTFTDNSGGATTTTFDLSGNRLNVTTSIDTDDKCCNGETHNGMYYHDGLNCEKIKHNTNKQQDG